LTTFIVIEDGDITNLSALFSIGAGQKLTQMMTPTIGSIQIVGLQEGKLKLTTPAQINGVR
jgi:hypothetical protein